MRTHFHTWLFAASLALASAAPVQAADKATNSVAATAVA